MLMDDIIAGMKSDVLCPSHPAPLVPLPSPPPDNITNAIQAVEKIFSGVIDDDTVVYIHIVTAAHLHRKFVIYKFCRTFTIYVYIINQRS